jgi:iron complex outermembrane receptor protein
LDIRKAFQSAHPTSSNAQIALPEVVVSAPSPIQRSGPPPNTTNQPAPTADLQGTLPIVTDQFATVTVVPNDDTRRLACNPFNKVHDATP